MERIRAALKKTSSENLPYIYIFILLLLRIRSGSGKI